MRRNSISETELRDHFVDTYKNAGKVKLYLEVPVFSRSVDLVIQDADDFSVMAVEFKLHDWRRAIAQVQSVAICFDYLGVCLPKQKTEKGYRSVVDACKVNRICLYLYDAESKTFWKVLDSPRTQNVWDVQKKRVMRYLEGEAHEGTTPDSEVQCWNRQESVR